MADAPGTLYVVATPLGNPADLSPRALETLRAVDLVLAEDTRTARRLLAAHDLDRPTLSCFDANEPARAEQAVALLRAGQSVALVSEAGTPAISDPGYKVVRAAVAAGARVVPVPGPAAFLAALVASGLPTDRFVFLGFPPRRPGARRALLERVRPLPFTLLLYESPHRAAETLAELAAVLGDRPACVARELTKTHEELVRGPLSALARRYAAERPLGEVTLVVEGAAEEPADAPDVEARAAALLAEGLSPRDAAARLHAETGRPRRELYALVLRLKK